MMIRFPKIKMLLLLMCVLYHQNARPELTEAQLRQIFEMLHSVVGDEEGVRAGLFFSVLADQGCMSYKGNKDVVKKLATELGNNKFWFLESHRAEPTLTDISRKKDVVIKKLPELDKHPFSFLQRRPMKMHGEMFGSRGLALSTIYADKLPTSQRVVEKREEEFGKVDVFIAKLKKVIEILSDDCNFIKSDSQRGVLGTLTRVLGVSMPAPTFCEAIDLDKAWKCLDSEIKPFIDTLNRFIEFEVESVLIPLFEEVQTLGKDLEGSTLISFGFTDDDEYREITLGNTYENIKALLEEIIAFNVLDLWMSKLHEYISKLVSANNWEKTKLIKFFHCTRVLDLYRVVVLHRNLSYCGSFLSYVKRTLTLISKEKERVKEKESIRAAAQSAGANANPNLNAGATPVQQSDDSKRGDNKERVESKENGVSQKDTIEQRVTELETTVKANFEDLDKRMKDTWAAVNS